MPDEKDDSQVLRGWKQIGNYFGVSHNTAKAYAQDKGLPVHRKGGLHFAFPKEIDEWISSDQDPTPEPKPSEAEGAEAPEPEPQEAPSTKTKPHLFAFIILLLGLVILAAWQFWPNQGPPAQAVFEDQALRVLDDEGRLVWERGFPDAQARGKALDILVRDVDADGVNEVVFNYVPAQSQARNGRVTCFDDDGEELWKFHFGREIQVGERRFEPFYHAEHLHWLEQGPYVLAVARQGIWYPAQVVLLEPSTGELVSEYWHPGYFSSVAVWDADNDGMDELLLGGTNNPGQGNGHPGLALFEIPFTQSQEGDPPGFFSVGDSRESKYLLFPRMDVQDVAEQGSAVYKILVRDDHVVLSVGSHADKHIYYYLGRDLEVLEVRASDNFVQEHNRLFREGVLDHPYQPSEAEEWGQVLEFPTAPNANSDETKALFYQE